MIKIRMNYILLNFQINNKMRNEDSSLKLVNFINYLLLLLLTIYY